MPQTTSSKHFEKKKLIGNVKIYRWQRGAVK